MIIIIFPCEAIYTLKEIFGVLLRIVPQRINTEGIAYSKVFSMPQLEES